MYYLTNNVFCQGTLSLALQNLRPLNKQSIYFIDKRYILQRRKLKIKYLPCKKLLVSFFENVGVVNKKSCLSDSS